MMTHVDGRDAAMGFSRAMDGTPIVRVKHTSAAFLSNKRASSTRTDLIVSAGAGGSTVHDIFRL